MSIFYGYSTSYNSKSSSWIVTIWPGDVNGVSGATQQVVLVWAAFFRCRTAGGTALTGRKISGLQDWEIGIKIQFILIFFYYFHVKVMIKSQFSDRAMKKQMKRGVAKRCVSFFLLGCFCCISGRFSGCTNCVTMGENLVHFKPRKPA